MTITMMSVRAVGLALAAGLLVACGGLSQEDLDRAREAGASEAASRAAEQQRTEELEQQVEELKQEKQENAAEARRAERRAIKAERRAARNQNSSGGGSTSTSGSATACGDGIYAGANTSCAFAMNVVGEYGSNPGASTIEAYSPVTGQYYLMSCGTAANGGHVCTGGNNAAVYFP